MKHRELIKRISREAKRRGLDFSDGEGSRHSKYRLDGQLVTIPHHADIPERTAEVIFKERESELGKGRWRQ